MSFSVMFEQLAQGMGKSIMIFALTLLFSLPLGLVIALGRMSKNKILSGIKLLEKIKRSGTDEK